MIPNGVFEIYENAFKGCDSLESITFNGTVNDWKQIIGNTDVTKKIICLDGVIN